MKAAILNGYDKNGWGLVLKDIPVPEINVREIPAKIRIFVINRMAGLERMIFRRE
ncbi:MAG: hypothetical protein IKN57_12465 [Parasporobacterium sp.]|nr:hypothetical protein [Parasporobacterium sp.]